MAVKIRSLKGKRKVVAILGIIVALLSIPIFIYLGWYYWASNVQADVKQHSMVKEFVQDFTPKENPSVQPQSPSEQTQSEPVVMKTPNHGETFGVIYIPRFGADYSRPLVQGVSNDVLDTLGIGHYQSTALPGGKGNFVVAGHRQTHGSVLDKIHTLQPGDKIYVQTKDGYYTYVYRNSEIVLPTTSGVLSPFPGKDGKSDQRIMTLTSCNPQFGSEERIIAYALMDTWRPASSGPPAEIAATVASLQNQ